MKTLSYDYCRCVNHDCIDRLNCLRATDWREGAHRLSMTSFPTPQNSGECKEFILNTTETDK